jgi:hypothetical protein
MEISRTGVTHREVGSGIDSTAAFPCTAVSKQINRTEGKRESLTGVLLISL